MEAITRVGGDEFATFVRDRASAFMQTAYLLTGDGQSAEDLVQETLVRLYPKRERVLAASAPVAYVRRSIVNTYLNGQRGHRSREMTVPHVPEQCASDAISVVADRDEVWLLLRRLPQRQRAALVLRYYHDLPDAEIAAALRCRNGTVRSLLSRGIAAMREMREGEE